MAVSRLTTTSYTTPGVYVGRVFVPQPSPPTGNRVLCLIGRGSRLQNVVDTPIIRSFVTKEQLIFTQVGTGSTSQFTLYQAQLQHRSNMDQSVAVLAMSTGDTVSPANWQFVEVIDVNGNGLGYATSIQMRASSFSASATYTFNYQSIDRNILDPIPWHPPLDMRATLRAGDVPATVQYTEFVDYAITMQATTPFDLTDPASTAGTDLATLKTLVPPATNPGLTLGEFVVDIANHKAGTYQFQIDEVTPPTASADGSIEYTMEFKPFGTFVYQPIGNFVLDIPSISSSHPTDPVKMVVDSQLTAMITVAHSSALVAGDEFFLNVLPFASLSYHPDFFDAQGRPRYSAKDTRTVDMVVDSVVLSDGTQTPFAAGVEPDLVQFTYTSSTPEGGFGTFTLTRPGTTGATGTIAPATAATITATNSGTYPVANGDTIFVVVDRTTIQTVTLVGVTSGAATPAEIATNLTNQLAPIVVGGSGAAGAVSGTKFSLVNLNVGANHQLQIVGGTAIGPTKIIMPGIEAIGGDATLTDINGNFGQIFTGRSLIFTDATNAANDGTFTVISVIGPTSLTFRNNKAVAEGPTINWQITSPEPNYDRAPFKDGIILELSDPENTAVGQHVQFTITNEHTIDWSLDISRTETFDATTIFTDTIGGVTGVAASQYVLLADIPVISTTTPLTVKNQSGTVLFTVTTLSDARLRLDADGNPTDILRLSPYTAATDGPVTISYQAIGAEPSPGSTYYFSAQVLRPLTNYNTVIQFFNEDDATNFLAPSAIDNHLFIATQIAFSQAPAPQTVYVIQVYDSDQDGIYNKNDYKTAEATSFQNSDITDTVVLSSFDTITDMKGITIQANNPFVKKWRLQWCGVPVNTPVGSANQAGSIVSTAVQTLQVYGDNQARGAFILVPNQWAKYTVVLNDGSSQQLTLDGSFLAVAGAAITCGFNVPYATILRQSVIGFDQISTFSDSDVLLVGAASTSFIYKDGQDYLWGESATVDTSEPSLNEISGRTAEQFVSRYVVKQVDANLVGFMPDSAAQLGQVTASFVAQTMLDLFAQRFISDWLDDNGNIRQFSPDSDVQAVADTTDPRNVYFNYCYFLRYPGKRFFGLYAVDGNPFGGAATSG